MERKEILKKLASYTLMIGILTGSSSILSGCNNVDNNIQSNSIEDNKDTYFVVYNYNNAIIYKLNNGEIIRGTLYLKDIGVYLSDYIKFEDMTIEEVESQVKALIGEDGNISYYGFDEEKTLKKIR